MRDAKTTAGYITRFKIQPGKEEQGHQFIRDTAALVQAQEPGTLVYAFFRGPGEREIVVFEVFTDAAARATHKESPIMKAAMDKVPQYFDMATFAYDALEGLAGFLR